MSNLVVNDLDFIGALALYQHRRDQALGFSWHSQKTLGLIWYYNQVVRQQIKTYVMADYLNKVARHNEARKNDILKKATRYKSPKYRKKALLQLQEIEQEQERIAKALGGLSG